MGGKKPYLAVILIRFMYAGMLLLSKAAFNGGMNNFVFVFYRQATATIFLIPLAIIFKWKRAPHLSFVVFCKIFMLSLCGITLSLNISALGLVYTSATLAAAVTNTLPVITFFLAVLLRMETVNLKILSGNAKILGVTLCMAGAAVLALYKGPHLKPLIHHHLFGHLNREGPVLPNASKAWIKGVFLMVTATILWGLWLVLQRQLLISYPSKLLFTTLQCFLSTIQSFFIAIAIERNLYQWKLHWDVRLLAVAYSGIVVTGVTFYIQAWCIEKKGPIFLAMSEPLCLIITIFCSAFLFGELINLGSILGGLLLVGGLYSVLWGKSKEQIADGRLPAEDVEDCLEVKETA